jgi:hypothetical protein
LQRRPHLYLVEDGVETGGDSTVGAGEEQRRFKRQVIGP